MRGLLLARIAYVRREGMIEGLAIDVLGRAAEGGACTEGGRSLLERYGMTVTSEARSGRRASLVYKKAAADFSQAA